MRVSNSKLKTFRRCQKQYEYKYVHRLTPKERVVQLERGTWIHALLEAWYLGRNPKKEHKKHLKRWFELSEEVRFDLGEEMPEECWRIFRNYKRTYSDDLERFEVIDAELDEIVTLPNGLELQIIIDLVMKDKRTGLLWPFDHKTRKNFADPDSMMLDPQLTLYYYGLEVLGYGPMGGVVYNELCTKPPTVPKLLASGKGLSKAKNISTDVATYMDAINEHGFDPADYADVLAHIAVTSRDKYFRRVYLPKDKPMLKTTVSEMVATAQDIQHTEKRGVFPRNMMPMDCKWSCSFRDVCLTQLHGGDAEELIRRNFNRRPTRRKDDVG